MLPVVENEIYAPQKYYLPHKAEIICAAFHPQKHILISSAVLIFIHFLFIKVFFLTLVLDRWVG
jgi:hypothetical protein